eukprot:scaffold252206_cov41-Tisochrysis_lutea.AAC.1
MKAFQITVSAGGVARVTRRGHETEIEVCRPRGCETSISRTYEDSSEERRKTLANDPSRTGPVVGGANRMSSHLTSSPGTRGVAEPSSWLPPYA